MVVAAASGHARADVDGQLDRQCVVGYVELKRQYIARGDLLVGDQKIPFVAKDDLAKEIAKVPGGDGLHVRGKIVAHDTEKLKHRGGLPFLELEVTEIVEWRKVPKTC